jgi:hypothetical protein
MRAFGFSIAHFAFDASEELLALNLVRQAPPE